MIISANKSVHSFALGYNEQMHEVSVMFFTLSEHD
jgi:hypothetical protein